MPRLRLLVDGEPVAFPPAAEGKATVYVEALGVLVTVEMTPEGVAKFQRENGMSQ